MKRSRTGPDFELIVGGPQESFRWSTHGYPFDLAKWRSSGVWDFIDSYYQKTHNIKLLALVALRVRLALLRRSFLATTRGHAEDARFG